ncbi:MAG: 50S ribosomal protein L13 [bacterium]|nr:50S ribosomal protein L13 [bacterium]
MTPLRQGFAGQDKSQQKGRAEEQRSWRFFDADGKILGRLATEVATLLRGKDQPQWVPYRDTGAVIVVTNTDRVRFTGGKEDKKIYTRHTQRKPGAFRMLTLRQRLERDSRTVVRDAVWNMLPKNKLRDRMITRLKLYKDAEHPHVERTGKKEESNG